MPPYILSIILRPDFVVKLPDRIRRPPGFALRLGCGLLAWFILVAPVYGQVARTRPMIHLQDALAHGNVEQIMTHVRKGLEINLFSRRRAYSRGQARYVLKRFFKSYPPRRFVLRDDYESKKGWFVAGDYWYGNRREPLRLYLRLRQRDKEWELRELIVEENHAE